LRLGIVNLEPHTEVLINSLTTNLNLHLADESVTEGIGPCNVVREGTCKHRPDGESRELYLKVNVVDQISIAGDSARDLAAEVGGAGEHLFDCLEGKIGMSAIDNLKNVYTLPFGIFNTFR
jgi:hypothetical protein